MQKHNSKINTWRNWIWLAAILETKKSGKHFEKMLNISGIYYLLLNLECAVLEKTETLFIGLVNPLTQVSVYGTGICSDCYFSLVSLKKKKKTPWKELATCSVYTGITEIKKGKRERTCSSNLNKGLCAIPVETSHRWFRQIFGEKQKPVKALSHGSKPRPNWFPVETIHAGIHHQSCQP